MSLTVSGAFWPTILPLFHGSRERVLAVDSMMVSHRLEDRESCAMAALIVRGARRLRTRCNHLWSALRRMDNPTLPAIKRHSSSVRPVVRAHPSWPRLLPPPNPRKRLEAPEAPKPQAGRLLRATTVAPSASSASASVCGSGTGAATSPGRTATAYNALVLPPKVWRPKPE